MDRIQYAVCLANDFGREFDGEDLMPGLCYRCLGEERGMLRLIDESGEDYLYPKSAFFLLGDDQSAVLAASLERLAA